MTGHKSTRSRRSDILAHHRSSQRAAISTPQQLSARRPSGHGYDVPQVRTVLQHDPQVAGLFAMLAEYLATGDPGSPLIAEQCIDLLCSTLLSARADAARTAADPAPAGLPQWKLRRVTEHMQAHLHRQIDIGELAAIAGLSRCYFCRAFRAATGQSPFEWLVRLRMEQAAIMLVSDDISITEIALAVGYGTPSSFTSRFRRQMGRTPSEYRRFERDRRDQRDAPYPDEQPGFPAPPFARNPSPRPAANYFF